MTATNANSPYVTPPDSEQIPRFAGLTTFARLPREDQVDHVDVGVLGIPFDSGVSYRPGARFGPSATREASRLLQSYNQFQGVSPFETLQVADLGDVTANPFNIEEALTAIEEAASRHMAAGTRLISIGGDHTIALPLLRAVNQQHGPVALLHFDAHLDTWDTYFGAPFTHGTPFLRAHEEGLLLRDRLTHIGTRAQLHHPDDLVRDENIGFGIISTIDVADQGVPRIVERLRARIGNAPVYVSIDIDVLDPSHAPGTGTPETGGLLSRELMQILRGLANLNIVGADVVEVAPAYDWAQITATAAASLVYELICLFALDATNKTKGQ
ncbi:agmatinase [Streptomyces sp. NPDC052042]|uniref:agmatinase n=1 Tax=Streptomyces sp. NPDC052042 TaxID=3365683 RepID=UPI0037D2A775